MIWHHLKFHVFWIELDMSLYAQKALLICHQFKHLETIFVSFFSFKKKRICHEVYQWNGNYISSPLSIHKFRLKELHAATALRLGVVIIKYRILRLSWQFVMSVPSLHWFLYFLATKVFHKNWVFTSSACRKSILIDSRVDGILCLKLFRALAEVSLWVEHMSSLYWL